MLCTLIHVVVIMYTYTCSRLVVLLCTCTCSVMSYICTCTVQQCYVHVHVHVVVLPNTAKSLASYPCSFDGGFNCLFVNIQKSLKGVSVQHTSFYSWLTTRSEDPKCKRSLYSSTQLTGKIICNTNCGIYYCTVFLKQISLLNKHLACLDIRGYWKCNQMARHSTIQHVVVGISSLLYSHWLDMVALTTSVFLHDIS